MATAKNNREKEIIKKVGGYLEGMKNGKKIITNNASLGGLAKGKKHINGGIKGINKSTKQYVEIEAGEPVINERSANMNTTHIFNGKELTNKQVLNKINVDAGGAEIKANGGEIAKPIVYTGGQVVITAKALDDKTLKEFDGKMMTNQQILSHINEQGGGLSFAKGGNMPGILNCSGKMYNFGGAMQDDYTIAKSCGCRHNKPITERNDFKIGIATETKEHQNTFDELYNREITPEEAIENVVEEHLAENSQYYQQQMQNNIDEENFANGGTITMGKHTFKGYNIPVTAPQNDTHKKMVLVKDGENIKLVKFGLRGMQDFTQHGDEQRRKNYLTRSAGIVDGRERPTKDNPLSANYWSRRILWDSGEDIVKPIYVDESVVLEDGGPIPNPKLESLKKDFTFLVGLQRDKENKQPNGWDINLFKSSFYNKVNNLSTEDKTAIFDYIEAAETKYKKQGILQKSVFTENHKIWKLKPEENYNPFIKHFLLATTDSDWEKTVAHDRIDQIIEVIYLNTDIPHSVKISPVVFKDSNRERMFFVKGKDNEIINDFMLKQNGNKLELYRLTLAAYNRMEQELRDKQSLKSLTQSGSTVIGEKEKPKIGKLKLSDIPETVKTFMPLMQQQAIVGSQEHWDIIDNLEKIINEMPATYGTENIATKDKIVWLHYFYNGSDWYIVEKDMEPEQLQAFGYTILNGDTENAEWAYIDIEQIKATNKIELDFFFEPIKFGELELKWEREDAEQYQKENIQPWQKIRDWVIDGGKFDINQYSEDDLRLFYRKTGFGYGNSTKLTPEAIDRSILLDKYLYIVLESEIQDCEKNLHIGQIIDDFRNILNYKKEIYFACKQATGKVWDKTFKENESGIEKLNNVQNVQDVHYSETQQIYDSLNSFSNNSVDANLTPEEYKEFRENEEYNNHVENVLLIAEASKNATLIQAAKYLVKQADKLGYVDNDLRNLSNRINDIVFWKKPTPDTALVSTTKYAYQPGDKVVFLGTASAIVNSVIEAPSTTQENGILIWKTKNGYKPENEILPAIVSARKQNIGSGYKMFKGLGGGSEYVVEFADGNHFTTSRADDRESAIREAIRHRLYTLKDYPKTVKMEDENVMNEEYSQIENLFENKSIGDSTYMATFDNETEIVNLSFYKTLYPTITNFLRFKYNELLDLSSYAKIKQQIIKELERKSSKFSILLQQTTNDKPETRNELNVQQLAATNKNQQHEINNQIRELVATKGTDATKYSAEEVALLKLYEGAGGLAKQGQTGARLLDQFFTPMDIIAKMWGLALQYGFSFPNANILEPSVGSGRFLSFIPHNSNCNVIAYDVDETSYKICKVLYPDFDIRLGSFESMFFMGKRHVGLKAVQQFFDLVITNPPYRDYVSEYAPLGEKDATGAFTFEMYFIMRGVDVLKSGGLLVMIVPNTFLSNDNKYNSFKEKLAQKADLIDAYRLPNGVFGNTDVGTDIIVLKKK